MERSTEDNTLGLRLSSASETGESSSHCVASSFLWKLSQSLFVFYASWAPKDPGWLPLCFTRILNAWKPYFQC
uniref:Uncharacterized protein n=1 Tax=Cucumis sativus TaxID=3659 RepID=A0A0A0KTU1_CUCSA